ncbi:MAG TPA: hypothetical protein VE398_21500 [Acidobacteriota bacterium]|nr:hypothetical protein [Acidobacteriota bacterium]
MSDLRTLLARALAAEGALVEAIEPEGLEIMATPRLQEALSLPEWSRVGFGAELPAQATRVNFESDWAGRLERLLEGRGRLAQVSLSEHHAPPPRQEFERIIQRDFALQNATFRLGQVEEARAGYLLLVFHVTASSDEKREDLVHLCINESNSAAADDLARPLLSHLRAQEHRDGAQEDDSSGALPAGKLRTRAAGLLMPKIRSQFSPFLAGMERRMARDLERLHVYHTDLRREVAERLSDKSRRGVNDEALKADRMRLMAIEREYHAKVADLRRKYAMTVEVRFLQALRACMPVRRAEVTLLRRKGSRRTHLDWNPITKRVDRLPCEGCWASPRIYSVCDERLHWVCTSCLSACPSCGKESCRACNPARCPRCSHPWRSETGH